MRNDVRRVRLAARRSPPLGAWRAAVAVCLLACAPAAAAGWENVGTKQGVRVSRMAVEGSSKFAFRGEYVANVHIGRVAQVFADPGSRRHWVDRWAADKELDSKGPFDRTYWIRFGLPFPVSDRDYVLHTRGELDAGKRVIVARIKSVNHPAKGEDSCCVRGNVTTTYYKFEAIPGAERTKLTVEVHTDPKGMLPGWLVNLIQKDWPVKTLTALAAAAQRPGVATLADCTDWHRPAEVVPAPAPGPAPAQAP